MQHYNYLISDESKRLFASLATRKLKAIEGYRYDLNPKEDKVTFYAVVRLHLEDGDAYDLGVSFVRVDIAEDFWDDVGVFSFDKAEGSIWVPEGIETFSIAVEKYIDEVILVNDYDLLKHNGIQKGYFAFTKGILFRSGSTYIAFAIDDFCEDSIVVRNGDIPEVLVPSVTGGWYDEPGWTDEYKRLFETI